MKKIIGFIAICLLLIGCSDEEITRTDLLSGTADFSLKQSFDLKEENSVSMLVEVYTNGHVVDENFMFFGNHFKGQGAIQFSIFKPNYTTSDPLSAFIIGVIQGDDLVISNKVITNSPENTFGNFVFDSAKERVITETGEYVLGVFGYLADEDALSPLFQYIKIEERSNFIEAYEKFPLVYVVVIDVQ